MPKCEGILENLKKRKAWIKCNDFKDRKTIQIFGIFNFFPRIFLFPHGTGDYITSLESLTL